jgi:cobalt-zinc-cadmium efflux system outer membrane protein
MHSMQAPIRLAVALCFAVTTGAAVAQGTQPAAGAAQGLQPPAVTNPPPVPLSQRVTLAQAVEIALNQNPQVLQATHQVASARANLSSQRAPLNPVFGYAGLNNTFGPINFSNPSNYSLSATIETSGRQGLRTKQARAQLQGTEADAVTTRYSIRQAAAAAYITLQVANSNLTNEQNAYETARRLSDLSDKQVSLGAAPETNAIRARIALTQEEQNLLQAVNNVNVARANLNIQLGRAPETPVDAAEPLEFRPIAVSLPDLQAQALRFRSEIRSAEATRRALQATEGLQRSQYYPDVAVGTDLKAQQVLVGVAVPLDLGSIRGAIRKAREDVHVQEAQELQVRQQVQLDVQSAYLALTLAQRTVQSFQDGILPRAQSLLQRIEQGYALGASTILDLIDAQETVRTTVNSYNSAIGDYRQAIAQLERAVGGPLPPASAPNQGSK